MELARALYGFMEKVKEDPRMGPTHISLFMAILYSYHQQEYIMPLSVYSKDLMKKAKIAGMGTYHKCMRELKEAGYIQYVPSFNPVLGSLVYLI